MAHVENLLDMHANNIIENFNFVFFTRFAKVTRRAPPRETESCLHLQPLERFTKKDCANNNRGKFSNIAWPAICAQELNIARLDTDGLKPKARDSPFDKVRGQLFEVAEAFAQRGDDYGEHRKSIIEIFTKNLL